MIEVWEPGQRPFTVPFALVPCVCVADHNPEPEGVEFHHVFPKKNQMEIRGEVWYHLLEPLCPTGHGNVHAYLDWLLGLKREKPTVGPYIRKIAREGYDLIVVARLEAA